jgi:hypothetical protein
MKNLGITMRYQNQYTKYKNNRTDASMVTSLPEEPNPLVRELNGNRHYWIQQDSAKPGVYKKLGEVRELLRENFRSFSQSYRISLIDTLIKTQKKKALEAPAIQRINEALKEAADRKKSD